MKCTRCNERESTGFLFALCDECFAAFEAEAMTGKVPEGATTAVNATLEADGYSTLPIVDRTGRKTVVVPKALADQVRGLSQ